MRPVRLTATGQAQAYILAVHLSMAALLLLSQLLLMPPVLSGYQVLWVLWIQTPLVAGSFLSSPHQKNLMKQMPRACWATLPRGAEN